MKTKCILKRHHKVVIVVNRSEFEQLTVSSEIRMSYSANRKNKSNNEMSIRLIYRRSQKDEVKQNS